MTRKARLEDVARAAGVSLSTASQVMRGTGRISEATRKKVWQAAQGLDYLPDARAAAMRSGQNREIGLVIHRIANPFNAEVISGVSDTLEAAGYLLSILDSRGDAGRQKRQLEAFIRSARGGLLWVPAEDTPPQTAQMLTRHRLPTVTFLRRCRGANFDHVGLLNIEATQTATNHLIDLGHTRIAFLGGLAGSDVRDERVRGYRAALALRGLGAGVVWDAPEARATGGDAMEELHRAHPGVTAVVCNGDTVALGALDALLRLGLVAGRDMSVIGFDDVADARAATPPLTTMAVSPYGLGQRLAQMMLLRIGDPAMEVVTSLSPARLMLRHSTGLAPGVAAPVASVR